MITASKEGNFGTPVARSGSILDLHLEAWKALWARAAVTTLMFAMRFDPTAAQGMRSRPRSVCDGEVYRRHMRNVARHIGGPSRARGDALCRDGTSKKLATDLARSLPKSLRKSSQADFADLLMGDDIVSMEMKQDAFSILRTHLRALARPWPWPQVRQASVIVRSALASASCARTSAVRSAALHECKRFSFRRL